MGLAAEVYARMQKALLPPGRLNDAFGAWLHNLLMGSADELVRVDARGDDLLREALPSTAVELLPEYEAQFGSVVGSTTEERQAIVTSAATRQQRYRPLDFQLALAPLLGQASDDVVVLERDLAMVAALGDQREIYRFFVFRDPAVLGAYFLEAAQRTVYDMSPSHVGGYVIESLVATCDDPFSLCDRDLVGL